MPNKKLLTIFLILLIIILLIFTVIYFIQNSKIPKDQTTQPTLGPTEEIAESKQIFSLKQVALSTDKQIYGPDEEIKVTAVIRNPFSETKNWTAIYYFMSEDEKSFSAVGQTKELKLNPASVYPFIQKIEQIIYYPYNVTDRDFYDTVELFSPLYFQLTGAQFKITF